jgi:Domain of unknown function (DUF4275)
MGQIELLKNKGVLITELENKGEELLEQWEEAFAKHLSKSQKGKIRFNQYLWHVFSFKKIKCLEGQDAIDAFNKLKKNVCYIFYQDDENALMIENANKLKAEDITNKKEEYIDDVYVVDKDFTWTYIYTHEEICGPYFYKTNEK